jgi:hypothetical protein
MESREIKAKVLNIEMVNEELFCGVCKSWINSVLFKIKMEPGSPTTYECQCGAIYNHS